MTKVVRSRFLKSFALTGAIIALVIISPVSIVFGSGNINVGLQPYNMQPVSVAGNRILYSNGQQYIPDGISVYGGLEATNYLQNTDNINAQIIAAAEYWHANTVRLQIAESNLFKNLSKGKKYNDRFLQAIIQQVNLSLGLHLFVVLNDQAEFTSQTPGPTAETVRFWQIMSQTFKNQPNVIFDLFNEPSLTESSGPQRQTLSPRLAPLGLHTKSSHLQRRAAKNTSAQTWNLWKWGGKVSGVNYIGMQTLVNQIRGYGVNNLIWVEGPNQARELPNGKYLIRGSNIVYSFHHLNINNPSSWSVIGSLSSIVPVVDGEWAQYQSPWAECFSSAYTNVPLYLNYLRQHSIGVIAGRCRLGHSLRIRNS